MRALLASIAAAVSAPALAQDASDTSQDLEWMSEQQAYLARLSAQDGWRWMPGGLKYRFVGERADGPSPSVADTVTLHYRGTLIDGTVFDSSYDRGEPATFPLGRLIRGWQMAVPQMGVGDTIEVAIPADLAYGPVGRGPIPGGATLLFTIELLGIGKE